MGRPPLGSGHAEHVDASEYARERLRWIMATLGGEATIAEACTALRIRESRFHELRERALYGAASALEPRRRGRPRTEPTASAETEGALRARVAALEEEVLIERTRAEVARDLPHLLGREPSGGRGEKRARGRRAGRGRASAGRARKTRAPRAPRDPDA